MRDPSHPCAVCAKAIRPGLLMCSRHWNLVPRKEQQAVYRTWAGLQGARNREALSEYSKARDAAVAIVNAQIAPPTPEPNQ